MTLRKTNSALSLSLITVAGCTGALAAEAPLPIQPLQVRDDGISPQAEETVWCTRWYEGRRQRRLWSITNRCWLTDWEDF